MTSPLSALTDQQRRTLNILRECGWLYKKAAARLKVPEATVRSRVHMMLRRADLPDRAELAYWMALEDATTGQIRHIRSHSEHPLQPE